MQNGDYGEHPLRPEKIGSGEVSVQASEPAPPDRLGVPSTDADMLRARLERRNPNWMIGGEASSG
jgi:hypothetical protein